MNDRFKYSPLPVRGLHIDLRGQMMRPARILEVMRDAASWGFNTVLLEYCDKFPYKGTVAEAVAPDALTRNEIKQIHDTASDLGLSIIPLVQCLGHTYWFLRKPGLRPLGEGAENPNFISRNMKHGGLTSLCPSKTTTPQLIREMISQVLEMHPGCRYFHLGGDEVALDPQCPHCAPRRESDGIAGIFGEYYGETAVWTRAQGPDPILWCDMVLAHPEALDRLRGKLIIMDWDYWSTREPVETAHAWGIPWGKLSNQEMWTEAQKEIVLPYFFTVESRKTHPFPYTPLLRDRGFPVIVGSGIRSYGDSFCVPKALSYDNVTSGALRASSCHVLGMIITNWALRRAPFPLTEYQLMAGAMTLANPAIDRAEIDTAFAEAHFGISDPEMARIPILLGQVRNPLVQSLPRIDLETGHWYATGYEDRITSLRNNPDPVKLFTDERVYLNEAAKLLERAKPRTDRQRERVALWKWAHETLSYLNEFGPQVLKEKGSHDSNELKHYLTRSEELKKRTDELIRPIMTDWTLEEEHQTRFGIHQEWIKSMI